MTFFQSIILGIVQGFTEFLPVSSSAHLRLTKWLMGVSDGEHLLYFDLICHSGTLLALIFFLRKDIRAILRNWKTMGFFLLALMPLVPAYFLLTPLRVAASDPAYLGCFLLFTALLLFLASKKREPKDRGACRNNLQNRGFGKKIPQNFASQERHPRSENQNCEVKLPRSKTDYSGCFGMKIKDVVCIGLMQTMALLPGVSRSGSTIAAARFLGWEWVAAARFSFLLAIPAILGGQALETVKMLKSAAEGAERVSIGCYAAGFCASFAIGLIGVRFVFWIYENGHVRPFAWYCMCAGLFALWALHG